MLYGLQWLKRLLTPDPIWRPYAFDRVVVCGNQVGEPHQKELVCLIGKCYSEFDSGPNLRDLAEATGALLGPGSYGLASCRPLGFRA